jgi:predicted transcriptional regulator of viral defense system
MQKAAFMAFLSDNQVPVFGIDDAVKILRKPKSYVELFLHRCVKKGLIGRVERGLYYVLARSNEYEIASSIVHPSYISMVSALSYYGLTTQIPRVVYVISTKRHKPIRNVQGFDIVFKRIKKEMLFGYGKKSGGTVFMADPEKAIVDIFYFHDVDDLDEDALKKPSRIDVDKLLMYAMKSGKRSVIAEVAKLLSDHGYAAQARRLLGKDRIKRGVTDAR